MTFEQRITAAKLLAGQDGIVCFAANGQSALVCGLKSATESEVMTALAAMHNSVVECAVGIYNSLNQTKLDRSQVEILLSMLVAESVGPANIDMRMERTKRAEEA